jgi:hemoglobin
MLSDQKVSHYFKTINMEKQKTRQKQFITLVTGGSNVYEGVDMKSAHCKMSISQ